MPSTPSEEFEKFRPPARVHHNGFKYAVVARALDTPRELLELCARADGLKALWDELGSTFAETDRYTPAGLTVRNVGDAARPVVMITLPAPERPNEAYYLCAVPRAAHLQADGSLWIPDSTSEMQLRVFGMERSMLPDGGLIGFVVEWTAAMRHNYDAPDDPSLGAFWKAILEIYGGTRTAVHSTSRA